MLRAFCSRGRAAAPPASQELPEDPAAAAVMLAGRYPYWVVLSHPLEGLWACSNEEALPRGGALYLVADTPQEMEAHLIKQERLRGRGPQ